MTSADSIPRREQGHPGDGQAGGGAGHREGREQPAVDGRQLRDHPQVPRRPKQVGVTYPPPLSRYVEAWLHWHNNPSDARFPK